MGYEAFPHSVPPDSSLEPEPVLHSPRLLVSREIPVFITISRGRNGPSPVRCRCACPSGRSPASCLGRARLFHVCCLQSARYPRLSWPYGGILATNTAQSIYRGPNCFLFQGRSAWRQWQRSQRTGCVRKDQRCSIRSECARLPTSRCGQG